MPSITVETLAQDLLEEQGFLARQIPSDCSHEAVIGSDLAATFAGILNGIDILSMRTDRTKVSFPSRLQDKHGEVVFFSMLL